MPQAAATPSVLIHPRPRIPPGHRRPGSPSTFAAERSASARAIPLELNSASINLPRRQILGAVQARRGAATPAASTAGDDPIRTSKSVFVSCPSRTDDRAGTQLTMTSIFIAPGWRSARALQYRSISSRGSTPYRIRRWSPKSPPTGISVVWRWRWRAAAARASASADPGAASGAEGPSGEGGAPLVMTFRLIYCGPVNPSHVISRPHVAMSLPVLSSSGGLTVFSVPV
jgi:hypothetical protein